MLFDLLFGASDELAFELMNINSEHTFKAQTNSAQFHENTHKPLSSHIFDLDKPSPQRQNAASCDIAHGELAQWLEQRNHNPLVPSSNLGFATNKSGG